MMEVVVDEGTGKNAKVLGYSIGGKTGTSEDGVNTNKYIASFVGVASIEEPELVMLVTLNNPTGEAGHQGGGVAAPVGGKILNEVLPYLEIQKNNEEEQAEKTDVAMPNLIGKSIEEAEIILKDVNLKLGFVNDDSDIIDIENTYVRVQIPETEIKVKEETTIYVEY